MILTQVSAEAPLVYLQLASDLVPEGNVVLVGTDFYYSTERVTGSAKVYIFVKGDLGWLPEYETDMDERIAAQGLPSDFELSLAEIERVDVDGDNLKEVVIFWRAEPTDAISMIQFNTILHILDYNPEEGRFTEVTRDQFVCNTFNELTFLLNVDCDPESEIVVFEEIWDPDTCVICAKRYRLRVWTMKDGELLPDPDWNDGKPWETSQELYFEECDFAILLSLVLNQSSIAPCQ
jgi:hypothetical protein